MAEVPVGTTINLDIVCMNSTKDGYKSGGRGNVVQVDATGPILYPQVTDGSIFPIYADCTVACHAGSAKGWECIGWEVGSKWARHGRTDAEWLADRNATGNSIRVEHVMPSDLAGTSFIVVAFFAPKAKTIKINPGGGSGDVPTTVTGRPFEDLPDVTPPTPPPGYEFTGFVDPATNEPYYDEEGHSTGPHDELPDELVAQYTFVGFELTAYPKGYRLGGVDNSTEVAPVLELAQDKASVITNTADTVPMWSVTEWRDAYCSLKDYFKSAAVISNGTRTLHETLQEAFDAAGDGDVVQLLGPTQLVEELHVRSEDFELTDSANESVEGTVEWANNSGTWRWKLTYGGNTYWGTNAREYAPLSFNIGTAQAPVLIYATRKQKRVTLDLAGNTVMATPIFTSGVGTYGSGMLRLEQKVVKLTITSSKPGAMWIRTGALTAGTTGAMGGGNRIIMAGSSQEGADNGGSNLTLDGGIAWVLLGPGSADHGFSIRNVNLTINSGMFIVDRGETNGLFAGFASAEVNGGMFYVTPAGISTFVSFFNPGTDKNVTVNGGVFWIDTQAESNGSLCFNLNGDANNALVCGGRYWLHNNGALTADTGKINIVRCEINYNKLRSSQGVDQKVTDYHSNDYDTVANAVPTQSYQGGIYGDGVTFYGYKQSGEEDYIALADTTLLKLSPRVFDNTQNKDLGLETNAGVVTFSDVPGDTYTVDIPNAPRGARVTWRVYRKVTTDGYDAEEPIGSYETAFAITPNALDVIYAEYTVTLPRYVSVTVKSMRPDAENPQQMVEDPTVADVLITSPAAPDDGDNYYAAGTNIVVSIRAKGQWAMTGHQLSYVQNGVTYSNTVVEGAADSLTFPNVQNSSVIAVFFTSDVYTVTAEIDPQTPAGAFSASGITVTGGTLDEDTGTRYCQVGDTLTFDVWLNDGFTFEGFFAWNPKVNQWQKLSASNVGGAWNATYTVDRRENVYVRALASKPTSGTTNPSEISEPDQPSGGGGSGGGSGGGGGSTWPGTGGADEPIGGGTGPSGWPGGGGDATGVVGYSDGILKWEGSNQNKMMKWASRVHVLPRPENPTAVRIDTLGYPVKSLTVSTFSSPDTGAKPTGEATLTNVSSQTARRLPVRRRERFVQVMVESDNEVDAILVGTSMEGIAV